MDIMESFVCECYNAKCREKIEVTEESMEDFDVYCYQRHNYHLISKTCLGISNFPMETMAVEGKDYYIFEVKRGEK